MARLEVCKVGDDEIFRDLVRVHKTHRKSIDIGAVVKVRVGKKSVLRVVRKPRKSEKKTIAIDYTTRKELSVSVGEVYDFKFTKANWCEELWWTWSASDPAIRAGARVSGISFLLGLVGLFLGVGAFFAG